MDDQRDRNPKEIFALASVKIPQDCIEQYYAREPCIYILPHVAPVEKHERRYDHHQSRRNGTPFAKIMPPIPCHPDGGNAKQSRRDAGRKITRAKQEVAQRDQMKLPGTMHHWGMLIPLSTIEQPREICVKALVMTHHTCSKVIKPCNDRQQDEPCKDGNLVGERRQCRVDGAFKPGVCFTIH